mgnify:CR=1 FL=1
MIRLVPVILLWILCLFYVRMVEVQMDIVNNSFSGVQSKISDNEKRLSNIEEKLSEVQVLRQEIFEIKRMVGALGGD